MYATENTTTGEVEIHTLKGSCTPSDPSHWLGVIEAGRDSGVYRSPFFDQLDVLIWQQAGGDDPPVAPVGLSAAEINRIALATATAVVDEQARRLEE